MLFAYIRADTAILPFSRQNRYALFCSRKSLAFFKAQAPLWR
jgi:hypothetical protein